MYKSYEARERSATILHHILILETLTPPRDSPNVVSKGRMAETFLEFKLEGWKIESLEILLFEQFASLMFLKCLEMVLGHHFQT